MTFFPRSKVELLDLLTQQQVAMKPYMRTKAAPVQVLSSSSMSLKGKCVLFAVILHLLHLSAHATVVAKSSLNQCTAYGGTDDLKNTVGAPCTKKLVVAMTVSENEVK